MKADLFLKKLFILLLFILTIVACSKDDKSYQTFHFKAIDFVSNTPVENAKFRFGLEIGCSKTLDFQEGYSNKKGEISFDLYANQDTIDAYLLQNPGGQSYLNNALEVIKIDYKVAQFVQDTGIFYIPRPTFQPGKLIHTYMYKAVPLQVEFKDMDNDQADKFLFFDINCYPKYSLLKYNTYEALGTYLTEENDRNFNHNIALAAIPYDIHIMVKDPIEGTVIFNQIFSITIDDKNPSNNVIKVDY